MDVAAPPASQPDIDPKQELGNDIERVRAERDDLDRQIAADRERLASIRVALDSMVGGTWRDVFGQQQAMRERENITSALLLGWVGGYQLVAGVAFVIFAAIMIFVLQITGGVIDIGAYLLLAVIGYFVSRDQCLGLIRKTRQSYLGSDGKDVRFVAFTQFEPGKQHPLVGYDGPVNGTLEDRSWKIPGVREKEALSETFVEVIDERRSTVLLTRFPDKKPTLVHADLENPFIRAYGVFFQRALERHLPHVQTQANEFRQIVSHSGERKSIDDRLRKLEIEMNDYDGTAAIVRQLNLPVAVRNRLLRQVILFRLADPAVRRGMLFIAGDRVDTTDVLQTLARAASATLLQLSFSQIKIGYVGQGASTVQRIFDTAKRARSIIFIDEAERFFGIGGSPAYESMRKEVVQAILTEWDGLEDRTDVWLVAVARERDCLDDAIVARFGTLLDFSSPAAIDDHPTTVVDRAEIIHAQEEEAGELPELVVQRTRLLSAMFAHVETMESQGITVPRAVLLAGPSKSLKQSVLESLRDQTSLPLFSAIIDDLDSALAKAKGAGRGLVAIDVPEYADPGAVAHMAVTLDALAEKKWPLFVLATTTSEEAIDPELRTRFQEVVDLAELDIPHRRAKLKELLGTKPLAFHLDLAMEELEGRTDGMTLEQLQHFVDEAGRKAALRAIDSGTPDQILITLDDFERRPLAHEEYDPSAEMDAEEMAGAATKDDEAAL